MQVEGFLCLTTLKYADEVHCDFTDCIRSEDGRRYLMIPLLDYPTFSSHMLEYYPKDPNAIREIQHPEYQFVCDEVVDLDAIEALPSEEDVP